MDQVDVKSGTGDPFSKIIELLGISCCRLDLNDGLFLIAMRCRCFFHSSDAMSMVLAIS